MSGLKHKHQCPDLFPTINNSDLKRAQEEDIISNAQTGLDMTNIQKPKFQPKNKQIQH